MQIMKKKLKVSIHFILIIIPNRRNLNVSYLQQKFTSKTIDTIGENS